MVRSPITQKTDGAFQRREGLVHWEQVVHHAGLAAAEKTKKAPSGKQRSQPPPWRRLAPRRGQPQPSATPGLDPASIHPMGGTLQACFPELHHLFVKVLSKPIAQPGSCGFTQIFQNNSEKEHACLSASACEGEGGRVRRRSAPPTARREPHPAEQSRHHCWTTDLGPVPAELLAGVVGGGGWPHAL